MMSVYKIIAGIISSFSALYINAQAVTEFNYTTAGSVYAQNFDGLPNLNGSATLSASAGPYNVSDAPISATGLTGWQFYKVSGSATTPALNINFGSSATGNFYSYGASSAIAGSGSEDRAIGLLASSGVRGAMGMVIRNGTAIDLTSFLIIFTGEQWRLGDLTTQPQKLAFKYKIGATIDNINQPSLISVANLDLVGPVTTGTINSALNGNLAANRVTVTFRVTGITWPTGQKLLIRWDDTDDGGADNGLAIDDFSFRADDNSTVPLTLLSFAFSKQTSSLQWQTTNEVNVNRYEVESSANGSVFSKVGTVLAKNVYGSTTYTFKDRPIQNNTYYRLKMIDNDRAYTYSWIVAVNEAKENKGIALYPNPVLSDAVIAHQQTLAGATFSIFSVHGQKVKTVPVMPGTVQTKLSIAGLPKGMYTGVLINGNNRSMIRLVKQ
jgi:Secretion system C-terminal sorting domain